MSNLEQSLTLAGIPAPAATPPAAPRTSAPPAAAPAAVAKAATPPATKSVPAGTPADVLPDELLLRILQTKRAHGSPGDNNFRLWLHAELNKLGLKPTIAKEGSVIAVQGKKSTTMFSCHIDTCHSATESDGSLQKLLYDAAFGHIFLDKTQPSGCLGGDDGVGVYIMLKMLKAKVPGTYVFHTGEERGGIGSRAILETRREWLKDFDRCVAFDRAVRHGESPEVILTQGAVDCASIAFGAQLVKALNEHEFEDPWKISHGGSFTDSKTYAPIIPECVNLGCFYVNQHTAGEIVDTFGVERLLKACLKIKWEDLKPSRIPSSERPAPKAFNYPERLAQKDFYKDFDEDLYPGSRTSGYSRTSTPLNKPSYTPPASLKTYKTTFKESLDYTKEEVLELVESDPALAADLLCLFIAKYKGLKAESDAFEGLYGA